MVQGLGWGPFSLALIGITLRTVDEAPCKLPYASGVAGTYMLREICSAEFPQLKLESARFALARRWIEECQECTGCVLLSPLKSCSRNLNKKHLIFQKINTLYNYYFVKLIMPKIESCSFQNFDFLEMKSSSL